MAEIRFPSGPTPLDALLGRIRELQREDVDWERGRVWSLVYHADADLLDAMKQVYATAFSLNGVSPTAFPSLARMEADIVGMTADLLGKPGAPGNVTSGGTESNLLAVKTARDWARAHRPEVTAPEIVVPLSAHPSLDKAGHYFGLTVTRVPVGPDLRADVPAMSRAIGPSTILLVGSAPAYAHGVVDPIGELAELARSRQLLLHVDACVGGFVLPFARRLGRTIPDFDLRVDGVTSISADVHKFGYSAKGASILLHRDPEIHGCQRFVFDGWNGGAYSTPTLVGTRPGGALAAAWAVLQLLGESGYLRLTERCLRATDGLMHGIRGIPGFFVLGEPHVNLFAFASDRYDLARIAGGMRERGWIASLQKRPPSIHLTVTANHERAVDDYLNDLRDVVEDTITGRNQAAAAPARYN